MNVPYPIGQLPSLTGMRWMAALLVFGLHLHVVEYFGDGVGRDALKVLFGAGSTGVSFFFILSGFVLAWSARPQDTVATFWWRRVARIYPMHLTTAVGALLLAVVLIPGMRPSTPELAANLLLAHSWNPDVRYSQSLNPVSWSLACEAFFYLLFPLLFTALRRLSPRGLSVVAGLCVLAVVAVPSLAGPSKIHYFPPARLPEFVLGIALACLVRAGAWRGPGVVPALGVLGGGYAVATVAPTSYRYAACTVLGFALLIAAAAGKDTEGERSWLGHPAMVRLGELSFAFYMIHIPVIRTGEALFAAHPRLATLPALGAAGAAFLVSLALSWLLWAVVETPARRGLLRLGTARRSRPSVRAEADRCGQLAQATSAVPDQHPRRVPVPSPGASAGG